MFCVWGQNLLQTQCTSSPMYCGAVTCLTTISPTHHTKGTTQRFPQGNPYGKGPHCCLQWKSNIHLCYLKMGLPLEISCPIRKADCFKRSHMSVPSWDYPPWQGFTLFHISVCLKGEKKRSKVIILHSTGSRFDSKPVELVLHVWKKNLPDSSFFNTKLRPAFDATPCNSVALRWNHTWSYLFK